MLFRLEKEGHSVPRFRVNLGDVLSVTQAQILLGSAYMRHWNGQSPELSGRNGGGQGLGPGLNCLECGVSVLRDEEFWTSV